MSQKVLVVGGSGFLGIHAIRELRQRGHSITSLGSSGFPSEQEDAGVRTVKANLNHLDEAALLEVVQGHDALVFAAGADDRLTPKRPCYPFFYQGNVVNLEKLIRLGKPTGLKRVVVLGSYFTHFNRVWPHLRLAERHPYICSRVEQQQVAFETAGSEVAVSFLELPYIFGAAPGKIPLWKPLVRYIRSTPLVFYTQGGTACVAAQSVGQAIAGAVERAEGHRAYPIGDENLTWPEMLTRLAKVEGRKIRVITLPNVLLSPVLKGLWLVHYLQGKESGLDPRHLLDLQAAHTYLDTADSQAALGYTSGLLNAAFKQTVEAC